jgi:hypothetical protein
MTTISGDFVTRMLRQTANSPQTVAFSTDREAMTRFDQNPHEDEPGKRKTAICPGCDRRYSFVKANPQPSLCQICDPGVGNKARLCTWCHMPFAMHMTDSFQCCSASCDWLLEVEIRDGRWMVVRGAPTQPWDEPGVHDGPELDAESRMCIDCGANFVPNRGRGMAGRGRARLRCYVCSPSKIA